MKSKTLLAGCGRRTVIKPASSRILISLTAAIHLVAISLLYFVDLEAWLLITIAGFILIKLYQHLFTDKMRDDYLSLQQGGQLLLKNSRYPGWQDVAITESFVSNWLIVLRLKSLLDSKKYSLVYAADSINRLSYRRLLIYLNHLDT